MHYTENKRHQPGPGWPGLSLKEGIMGLFDGIGDAAATGGREPWLTPGKYLIQSKRHVGAERTKKGGKWKDAFFRVDMTIRKTLEVYQPSKDEVEAGIKATLEVQEGKTRGAAWHVNLSGEYPDTAMGHVKGYMLALLEPDDDADLAKLAGEVIDGDGTDFAGEWLVAEAYCQITGKGIPFTAVAWSPGWELAVELGLEPEPED